MSNSDTIPVDQVTPIKPRCHVPWQQMVIDSNGLVSSCAYRGAYGNVQPTMGNVNETSILEVWNNQHYQDLRRYMAAGDLEAAGCANCYALKQGLEMALMHDADCEAEEVGREPDQQTPYYRNLRTLREEVAAGATVLESKPTVINRVSRAKTR